MKGDKTMQKYIPTRYAIVTDYVKDRDRTVKHETIYYKDENGHPWEKVCIDGETFGEPHFIYKVDTDKPYVRDYCRKWYITDNHLAALRSLFE